MDSGAHGLWYLWTVVPMDSGAHGQWCPWTVVPMDSGAHGQWCPWLDANRITRLLHRGTKMSLLVTDTGIELSLSSPGFVVVHLAVASTCTAGDI